jgi:predicted N-acetyltransferase YhbS
MLDPAQTPHEQPLPGGLQLRTAASVEDVERVAAFNAQIHGAGVGPMTRALFLHHPATRGRDLVFVEDKDGTVVSSLCVIPWTWSVAGVALPAGELGIVGTLPSHRRQGLIRTQVEYFRTRLAERGCLLSHLQGIPYYYRQFGYTYALPLNANVRLELRDVPAEPAPAVDIRQASAADIPALAQLYAEAARDLDIHAVRDRAIWEYLFAHVRQRHGGRVLACRRTGRPPARLLVPTDPCRRRRAEGRRSLALGHDTALAVLQWLKARALRRPPRAAPQFTRGSTLVRLARALGAHDRGAYAWQIHLPDVAALLRASDPRSSASCADSPFAGSSAYGRSGCTTETIVLRFAPGGSRRWARRAGARGADPLPARGFVRLLLDDATLEALHVQYPDAHASQAHARWRRPSSAAAAFIYHDLLKAIEGGGGRQTPPVSLPSRMKVTRMLTWYSAMRPSRICTRCSLTQALTTLRSVLFARSTPWSRACSKD